jgi:uncharacterized membrane protein (UPF0127 family)
MNKCDLKKEDRVLLTDCRVADSFFPRFLGLMGRKSISADQAIFFPKCNSIHTFFMRFPIDVVLLDEKNSVVEVIPAMREWRMIAPRRKVKNVLELRANRCAELGIKVGDVLKL